MQIDLSVEEVFDSAEAGLVISQGRGFSKNDMKKFRKVCILDANSEEATVAYAHNYDALLRDLKAQFVKYTDGCTFIDAGVSTVWAR